MITTRIVEDEAIPAFFQDLLAMMNKVEFDGRFCASWLQKLETNHIFNLS